jgi:hypothetical protein
MAIRPSPRGHGPGSPAIRSEFGDDRASFDAYVKSTLSGQSRSFAPRIGASKADDTSERFYGWLAGRAKALGHG